MPDREPEAGHSARLLRGLIWAGVLLAPLAAVVVLLGGSSNSVRFAVLLLAVSIVLVGASVLIRNDPGLQRMDVEDRVAEEVATLRRELRAEFGRAARGRAARGGGTRDGGAGGNPARSDGSGDSGFFLGAPMLPASGGDPFAPDDHYASADGYASDEDFAGDGLSGAQPGRREPGTSSGGRAIAVPGTAVPQQRADPVAAVQPPQPTSAPRASAAVRPGAQYGRPESLPGDFGASNVYPAASAGVNGTTGPAPRPNGMAGPGPRPNGMASPGPHANGAVGPGPRGPNGMGGPGPNGMGGPGPNGMGGPGPNGMRGPGGGPVGAASVGGTYGRPSNGFGGGSPGGHTEPGNEYGAMGPAGESYEPADSSVSADGDFGPVHDGYGPAGGGFDHGDAGGYGADGTFGSGESGYESGTRVYSPGDGAYESGTAAYESGDGGYENGSGGYEGDGGTYGDDGGYGADDGYVDLPEQSTGDPNYKARRHRPSANDTNVGTLADFAAFGGYQPAPGPTQRADERYVQGYGDNGRW